MLRIQASQQLAAALSSAIAGMGLRAGEMGKPELVERTAIDAERLFQGYARARPSAEDAYAAARSFLRGEKLNAWQRDLVASALAQPIREQGGTTALESKALPALLDAYEREANAGELWRLTWHGLLYSYFSCDAASGNSADGHHGREQLRGFLERTWALIDQQSGNGLLPEWVEVLRREGEVLGRSPTHKYELDYLRGESGATDKLAADLGISPSSWFWHALVLGAIKRATGQSDPDFKALIPRLLQLIETQPGFRDEALEAMLIRYHACREVTQDEQLRDYVCQQSVWKNPKLKAAGIATAWNRVPDDVWRMVLAWVNERNLKDFFDILAARNKADEGRLAFWSKYLKQITWTRLVFGADTMALKRSNPEVRDLIAREEGAFAQLTGKREVDAFMMQIGDYLIIEFSKKPNACYVYKSDRTPFDRYRRHYDGGTQDLAAGFHGRPAARIVHRDGWQYGASSELASLGIRPDPVGPRRISSAAAHAVNVAAMGGSQSQPTRIRATATARPNISALQTLIDRFQGASIADKRDSGNGGRLWVEDPLQRSQLARELQTLGFKWAERRQAWYFPEQ